MPGRFRFNLATLFILIAVAAWVFAEGPLWTVTRQAVTPDQMQDGDLDHLLFTRHYRPGNLSSLADETWLEINPRLKWGLFVIAVYSAATVAARRLKRS